MLSQLRFGSSCAGLRIRCLQSTHGITSLLVGSSTGLTAKDISLLVRLKVLKTERMKQAVLAFRRWGRVTPLHERREL